MMSYASYFVLIFVLWVLIDDIFLYLKRQVMDEIQFLYYPKVQPDTEKEKLKQD